MISSKALNYCERGIIRYLNGDTKEFVRLVNMAVELNRMEPQLVDCRYKVNGHWIDAKINWSTGEIFADGKVIRRCSLC